MHDELLQHRQLMPRIAIGGLVLDLDANGCDALPDSLLPYVVESASGDLRCVGRRADISRSPAARTLFDSGGVWRVDEDPRGLRIVVRSGGPGGTAYQVLRLNGDLREGEVVVDPTALGEEVRFALREPLLELWYSFVLMRGAGLLLHGLGVLVDGAAHVFLGESGAGKSTLGRVFHGEGVGLILSDDRLVVRPEGDGFRVFGTPWHGEARFASAASGPLASVHFLAKGAPSRVEDVSPDAAAGRLLACCFMAGWPRSDVSKVLQTCADISRGVRCAQLRFTPDRSALVAAGLLRAR